MNDTHITFRKVAIGASIGLMVAVVGGILVKVAISEFAGSPPWQLPAIIIGALAAPVIAVLIVPTIIEERRRAKHGTSASR